MRVIFLKDVANVGYKYDVKNVADGYALNFLIPQKLAELATDRKIREIEIKKHQKDEEYEVQHDLLLKNLKALGGASVEMSAKANEKGHLFKGIHVEEIAEELRKQDHIDLKPEHIQLEHPIKEIGEFDITAKVSKDSATFKLIVNKVS
jgi:large subunit ribosomal protein L9